MQITSMQVFIYFKELFIQFNVSSRAFDSMRISAIVRTESNVTYFDRSPDCAERKRMQKEELKLAAHLTFAFFFAVFLSFVRVLSSFLRGQESICICSKIAYFFELNV